MKLNKLGISSNTPHRSKLLRSSVQLSEALPTRRLSFGRPSRSNYALLRLALIACLALVGLTERSIAQAAFSFPSSVAVDGTPEIQSVTVEIQSTGTLGVIEVLTQGVENADFASSGGTCIPGFYAKGQVCSVSVSFAPKYPGLRSGAVVILANDGHVMASQDIFGVATGSLSVMAPGEIYTLAGDGCLSDGSCLTSGITPATSSALNLPMGVAVDGAGNLYISDTGNNRIRKVDSLGNITTIAGNSEISGFTGDGGAAINAQISAPSAILIDGAGNLFFADTGNDAIREINSITGNISTIAGTLGTAGYAGDGVAATSALLSAPEGIAFDASGNLYIADTANSCIRKVDDLGNITTIAGTATAGFVGDGGPAVSSQLDQPWSVAVGPDGNIYVSDLGNNRIRRINTSTGIISTVAGNGNASYAGDGGSALSASLNSPTGIAVDPAGNFYIADSENNVVRKVNCVNGNISTIAGNGTAVFGGDGFNATAAGLYIPYSVAIDAAGDLFIADRLDLRIREVSATAAVIKYPTMKEGKTSAPISQAIENDGNTSLQFVDLQSPSATSDAALDTNPTDPITTTCSVSQAVAVDTSCELAVEFTPVTVGNPGTGNLSVTSDSGDSPLTVNLIGTVLSVDPSSTTVTSSLNPAAVGMAVTFVAHIASPNQDTGTVQFYDGAIPIGVPQPVNASSDTASITTSFSVLQVHSITAVYSGDDLNAASTPNAPLIQIIQQATNLNVIPSANPITVFAPLQFNATVSGWTAAPTGNITFSDGSTPLGSASLNSSGVASFTAPPLAVGKHNIVATFAGDANDFTSQYAFVQTIALAPSSTSLGTSTAVAKFSTPITFTATVTGVNSSIPTGNVNFDDGTTVLATAPLNALGVATYVNSTLVAGTHTITAVYDGDADYAASTSTQIITETISQSATATTLSTSTTNSISGRPITLTANVTALGDSAPTGTVNFMNGNILLGTESLNNGTALFTTSTLGIGADNVTALYSGDSNNTASKSLGIEITVLQAPTTTSVSSSQSPVLTLAQVTIAATVSNGGSQSPTGLVTFSEDSVSIGVGSLNANGIATISIPSLTAGSHTFVASYAGDTLDVPSVSAAFVQTVQERPTTDTLTTSATSLSGGQQLTLISVVHPTGATPLIGPTGNVTFMSGDVTLATVPIDNTGVATVTVNLSGSSATITSIYAGDYNYAASSSAPVQVSIGPAPDFSVQATPTSWQMQSKQHLTVKLTLTSVKNFASSFSLGCLGLPQNATCTFSQDKPVLAAGSTQSVDVTVDTGTPLLGGTQARDESDHNSSGIALGAMPGFLILGFLSLRAKRLKLTTGLVLTMLIFGISVGLSGCGSIQNEGTRPGSYNFLITATTSTGVTQFVNMTMTITQ